MIKTRLLVSLASSRPHRWGGAFLAVSLYASPTLAGDPPLEDYVVQKGDTCFKIAKRRFGNGKRYDLIHEHNQLGPTPHRLQAGQVLRLPVTDASPDAEVTRARRDVRARAGSSDTWADADPGLDLYRGWRVNTLERASAEVTFQDRSAVQLRQNTLVIIYGGSAGQARRKTSEAQLERGTLRSKLGALAGRDPGESLAVRTPASQAQFSDTEALVTVQDDGTTLVGNHGDGKASVRGAGKRVSVGPKMGSKVRRGKRPSPPKPLPPAPAWGPGPELFVGIAGFAGTISGEWGAVDLARSYLVQVSADALGDDLVSTVRVPASVTRFEARGLPPGDYWAAISSIDAEDFESPVGVRRKLTVVGGALALPGGGEPQLPSAADLDPDAPTPAPRVLPGTRFEVPARLRCAIDGDEPGAALTLVEPGRREVSCVDSEGRTVPGFVVEVDRVEVSTGSDAGWPLELPAGETAVVQIEARGQLETPEVLDVRPGPGLEVESVSPLRAGAWEVRVRADPRAPERTSLALAFMSDGAPFETLAVRVPPAVAAPPAAEVEREGPMFELGLSGGLFFPSANHALGQAGVVAGHERFTTVAPKLDFRFSYLPLRWVGLEFESGVGFAKLERGPKARLIGVRGHLLGQLPYRVTPIVYLGGGAVVLDSALDALGRDVRAGMHVGLGMKAHLTRTIALRLDVRDSVLRGHGKPFSNNFELTIGLSAVFGRRGVGRSRTSNEPAELGGGAETQKEASDDR
jgi:hypothetical protein